MTSAKKLLILAAVIGAIGAATYFLTIKPEQQTAENISNTTNSKDVVIEENTLKQLKSLGYTN